MQNDTYQTPKSKRTHTADFFTEQRYKHATIESRTEKNPRISIQQSRWQNHQHRRENRMSSLLKARKEKLEEITDQNRKIFLRINKQESYYSASQQNQSIDKHRTKENTGSEKLLGPIGIWEGSSCFIAGARGIMCQRMLGLENIITKPEKKASILPRLQNIQKQNILQELIIKTNKHLQKPLRQRNLSDLYMLM